MRKILLFGRGGQLGWELQRALAPLGEILALDYPRADFSKPEALRLLVRETQPDLIVNPAAYTAVDRAETESELAFRVNAQSPAVLAEEALRLRVPLVHYSTDYVFDGAKGSPYLESDEPAPLNVYGHSKLAGDRAVISAGGAALILRTSWVYSMRQGGFVTKVLQWARQQEVMRVVDDQISGPTSARMLAELTALLLAGVGADPFTWLAERAGVYHCAGDGACSRYAWAQEILKRDPRRDEQIVRELLPASSGEFPSPAARPLVTVLDCTKLERVFGLRLPPWQTALKLAMENA